MIDEFKARPDYATGKLISNALLLWSGSKANPEAGVAEDLHAGRQLVTVDRLKGQMGEPIPADQMAPILLHLA